MNLKINQNNLILFSVTFIIFTIIGTLSHEYGHYIVAKKLGYQAKLHHASTSIENEEYFSKVESIYNNNKNKIDNNLSFREQKEYEYLIHKIKNDTLLFVLGGVISTILIGTVGFIFLFFRKKYILKKGLKILDWIFVFFTLFWLREIFILFQFTLFKITSNRIYKRIDEVKISKFLEFPTGTVVIFLGSIGLLISLYVIYKVIPSHMRFTFILSGFIGGILGLFLWYNVGIYILP